MNIRAFTFLLATLVALLHSTAQAELVWSPNEGWRIEGGAAAPILGDEFNAGNALELMNLAATAQDEGNYFQALRMYKRVYKDYSASIYAPEALFQSARVRIERHQYDDAFEALNNIIELYPDYDKFNRVIGLQFEIASQLMEGKRPYYWGVIPGLRDESAAMDYFEGVVENAPYSRYAPIALMNVALIAQAQGKTEEAIDAMDRLITNYPKSVLAPDAYLNLAKTFDALVDGAYYDQGATREAISYYQDFLILYPEDNNLEQAERGLNRMLDTLARSKFLVGDFYWRYRNNPTAAKIFLNDAITVAPESPSAQQARELLDKIESGVNPPSTPVDWLFGEYKNPSSPEYQEETEVNKQNEAAYSEQVAEDVLQTPGEAVDETVGPGGKETTTTEPAWNE